MRPRLRRVTGGKSPSAFIRYHWRADRPTISIACGSETTLTESKFSSGFGMTSLSSTCDARDIQGRDMSPRTFLCRISYPQKCFISRGIFFQEGFSSLPNFIGQVVIQIVNFTEDSLCLNFLFPACGHRHFQLPGGRLAMMLTTLNVITTSPA